MLRTAKQHFNEDMSRAQSILDHAKTLLIGSNGQQLRDDLLRSAWMFSVGAMDAYFCDSYADLLARLLRAKNDSPGITLDQRIANVELPVGIVLSSYGARENWRWRMAARKLMERENVLSIEVAKDLFNPFFRKHHRFFEADVIDAWISSPQTPYRLFGVKPSDYTKLTSSDKEKVRKRARQQMQDRFKEIIQRRHDCIHNCDRPKTKVQKINSPDSVQKVLDDVRFLIDRCDEYIDVEFPRYLHGIGCTAVTLNKLGFKTP